MSEATELTIDGVKPNDGYYAYVKIKEPDEPSDIKIRQGPGHICVINKRTGRGFYADFD